MKQLVFAVLLLALAACAPVGPAITTSTAGQPVSSTSASKPPAAAPTESATPTDTPASEPSSTATVASNNATVPAFSHVYLIVMENKEYSDIVGKSSAPFINDLIGRYGLATNYTAVAHPSQPNYIALFSGSTQGIKDDLSRTVDGANLADQLEAAGKTWRIYQQNYPSDCFTGSSADGGLDGKGEYVRKHNPAISFVNIASASERCGNIMDFGQFDPAASDYAMIVPNICNDMHDCPVSVGDAFLKDFVTKIVNSDAWKNGGVLFVTWDEGSTNQGGGGRVATLVISNRVQPGFQSSTPHNHYSLLRTIQDAWALGCLAESCSASNMGEFFK